MNVEPAHDHVLMNTGDDGSDGVGNSSSNSTMNMKDFFSL